MAKPYYSISTTLNTEENERLEQLKSQHYKAKDVFLAGIEALTKKEKQKNGLR